MDFGKIPVMCLVENISGGFIPGQRLHFVTCSILKGGNSKFCDVPKCFNTIEVLGDIAKLCAGVL